MEVVSGSIFNRIREWVMNLFNFNTQDGFNIEPLQSSKMQDAIYLWEKLEKGEPPWSDGEDIRSISFSNTIARELANLITLNIDVKISNEHGGTQNAEELQKIIDESFLRRANEILERMIRLGGVMAKWNGETVEYLGPDNFIPIEADTNGNITSCVFLSTYIKGRKYYTRAEWHRFEDGVYKISNRAYISEQPKTQGQEIPLSMTKWEDIQPEAQIEGLEKPLYVYLKNPYSNTIDKDSPLGVSIFAECIEELRWLDIAMSTLGTETEDSKPVLFIDSTALRTAKEMKIQLPRFVQAVGDSMNVERQTLSQWTPTLQIASRKEGINFYLSIISYKCGFDPGFFVFNGQQIMTTATQVEATERRTINTVLSYRSLLDRPTGNGDSRCGFLHDIAYIIDAMRTATGKSNLSDYGNYRIYADFKDLTSNEEEDRAFDYQLASSGYMSKWRYLVRHLGVTEEEAKQMIMEAITEQQQQQQLFSEMMGNLQNNQGEEE